MSETVGFALGSNIGDRAAYLTQARERLGEEAPGLLRLHCSRIYESAALLPEDAQTAWDMPYLNQVAIGEFESLPDPLLLLDAVKRIERELGRQVRAHWGPREIDVDLLFVGDLCMESPELSLPHAHMQRRNFVMVPLAEIAPDWRHPVTRRSAADMASELSREGIKPYAL